MDEMLIFENEEWTVVAAGLEHKQNGYFIAREHLDARETDGLWSWPLHMSDKLWCTPQAFAEAFMHAMLAFGIEPDTKFAESFLTAGRREIERDVWDHVAKDLGYRGFDPAPMQLGELVEIAVEVCLRTGLGPDAGIRILKQQRIPEKLRRSA
jgi:hypothetical protein